MVLFNLVTSLEGFPTSESSPGQARIPGDVPRVADHLTLKKNKKSIPVPGEETSHVPEGHVLHCLLEEGLLTNKSDGVSDGFLSRSLTIPESQVLVCPLQARF